MSPELKIVNDIWRNTLPPHRGLVFDIYEKWADGKPRAAIVRLYRDNFEGFSEDQKVSLSLWVSENLRLCRQAVGPNVFLEVAPYVSGRG